MDKIPVIELMDYNLLMSMLNYVLDNIGNTTVNGKSINVFQSYSDKRMPYVSPAISLELLNRKNKSVGFSNFLFEDNTGSTLIEFEGVILEYTVQLNVYSNTRGEIHKWCSIIDAILKNGEQDLVLNTYNDNGSIKQANVGELNFAYDTIKTNNLIPNVITSDFHSLFEVKVTAVQKYSISYDYMELGNITGNLK